MVKLLLIGDSGVGKSCLLVRLSEDRFNPTHIATIGIDFKVRTVKVDGYRVKLQIWDTAGQERFRTITQAYYRSAMGVLLVYDVGNRESFNNTRNWLQQIEQHASGDIDKVLVGNKCDNASVEVTSEEAAALAAEYGIDSIRTSARTGEKVEDAFVMLATKIIKRLQTSKSLKPRPADVALHSKDSSVSKVCGC